MSFFKTEISGLKCDNKCCSYKNESITLKEYPLWLNRSCPDCGENLLTEKDYKTVQRIKAIENLAPIRFLNFISDTFLSFIKPTKTKLSLNGDGKIRMK